MHDQVERFVRKHRQIGHIALHGCDRKSLPLGDETILTQLPRRIIEQRDDCPRRGEHWSLLSAPGSKAQRRRPRECREPIHRHRPGRRQQQLELAASRPLDRLFADRNCPRVLRFDISVPGRSIVGTNVHSLLPFRMWRHSYNIISTTEMFGAWNCSHALEHNDPMKSPRRYTVSDGKVVLTLEMRRGRGLHRHQPA